MSKRRRAVVLEEEMADPGEAVSAQQRHGDPPHVARERERDETEEYERRADEMQPAACAVGVLREIDGIELAKRRVLRHRSRQPSFFNCGNRMTSRIDGES